MNFKTMNLSSPVQVVSLMAHERSYFQQLLSLHTVCWALIFYHIRGHNKYWLLSFHNDKYWLLSLPGDKYWLLSLPDDKATE